MIWQKNQEFDNDDNRYYEKVGLEVKDITDDLPFEIPDSWVWCRFIRDTR